jgi:tetratricopeptide (TPR) repeat protein
LVLGEGPFAGVVVRLDVASRYVVAAVQASTGREARPQPVRILGAEPPATWRLRVWEAGTGRPVGPGCSDSVTSLHGIDLSRDGRRVVVLLSRKGKIGNEERVELWDATKGKLLIPLTQKKWPTACQAVFSPDGKFVAGLFPEAVVLWDTATGKAVRAIKLEVPRGRAVDAIVGVDHWSPIPAEERRLTFSPDGRQLAAAPPGSAKVWLCRLDRNAASFLPPPRAIGTHVTDVLFSPDGSRAATLYSDGIARVWQAGSGRPLTSPLVQGTTPSVSGLLRFGRWEACFSGDGRILATVIHGKRRVTGRLWDVSSGLPLTPLTPLAIAPSFVAFGPADRQALARPGTARRQIAVWETPRDERPAADLIRRAELLSGQRVDAGVATQLDKATLAEHWRALHGRYPSSFTLPLAEIDRWHRREASACDKAGDSWSAVFHLTQLRLRAPADRDLARWHGALCERLGLIDAATADYADVLLQQPADGQLRRQRIRHLIKLGWHDEAAQELTRYLEAQPKDAEAHWQRGQVRAELRRWKEALADFDAASVLKPKAWQPWQGRSRVHYEQGDKDRAAADLAEALRRGASEESICWAEWQWRVALAEVERLFRDNPRRRDLYRRGRILAALGRWEQAAADLRWTVGLRILIPRSEILAWGQARLRARGDERGALLFAHILPPTGNKPRTNPWLTGHVEACLRLAAGDRQGYDKVCTGGLAKQDDFLWGELDPVTRACSLAPKAVPDLDAVVRLAEKHLKEMPGFWRRASELGAILYRAGRDKEAVKHLNEAVRQHADGGDGFTCLFLALAHHRLGHAAEASKWLARAAVRRDEYDKAKLLSEQQAKRAIPDGGDDEGPGINLTAWWDWVELELLWPEAEAAFGLRKPPPSR